MNKVYIVYDTNGHTCLSGDGDEILGIFTKLEDAREHAHGLTHDQNLEWQPEDILIYEVAVDKPNPSFQMVLW